MHRLCLLILSLFAGSHAAPLQNCPMTAIRQIIQRATVAAKDPATQMQMIRRILEDIHGGSWGVLIIRNPHLVSQEVHWTIPDHNNADGSPAFCLAVVNRWQYNVFKTGNVDRDDRVTVQDVVNKVRQHDEKLPPSRLTVAEFDQRLADAIDRERREKAGTINP